MKMSKKKTNAFSDNHMLTSWFKFQLDSSNGVGRNENASIPALARAACPPIIAEIKAP